MSSSTTSEGAQAFCGIDWQEIMMSRGGRFFTEACLAALNKEFEVAASSDLGWAYAVGDEIDRICEVGLEVGRHHFATAVDQAVDYPTKEDSIRSHHENLLDTLSGSPTMSSLAEGAFLHAERSATEGA